VQSLLLRGSGKFSASDYKTLFCGVLNEFAGIQQKCGLFGV
jgi:hypothetical protein